MAAPVSPPPDEAGFFEHGRALLAALSAYLPARLALLGIETKEALVHFGIILGLVILALCVVIFGYLFLCFGLVMLVARLLEVHVEWIVLGFALVHFLVAIGCLVYVRTRLNAAMFGATLAEFKKDQQWLNTAK